jgi:hypothetical protein
LGHTTGLHAIRNRTNEEGVSAGFSIVKLEWPATTRFIAAGTTSSLQGDAIPWAVRQSEILLKAFLFRRNATTPNDGIGAYYLFQDADGVACWAPYNNGNPSYEQRVMGLYSDFGVNVDIRSGSLSILPPLFAPS